MSEWIRFRVTNTARWESAECESSTGIPGIRIRDCRYRKNFGITPWLTQAEVVKSKHVQIWAEIPYSHTLRFRSFLKSIAFTPTVRAIVIFSRLKVASKLQVRQEFRQASAWKPPIYGRFRLTKELQVGCKLVKLVDVLTFAFLKFFFAFADLTLTSYADFFGAKMPNFRCFPSAYADFHADFTLTRCWFSSWNFVKLRFLRFSFDFRWRFALEICSGLSKNFQCK